jgi:predicted nucleic acid-binding protein
LTLVIDSSAVVELLLATPAGERVELHVTEHDYDVRAPHLLDVEVLSALRRVVAAGEASSQRGAEAISDLDDLPIERYPHGALAMRIWSLKENFTAYDATYLALAETVAEDGAALLTSDARFARAAGAHSEVEVLLED